MTDNRHVLVPEAGAARSTLIVFGVLTVIGSFSFPALNELSFSAYGSAWTIVGLLCIIAGLFAKRINDSIEALAINHEKNLVRQKKLQECQVHPGIPRKVELIIFIVVSILLAGLVEQSIYLTGMTTFVMYSIIKVLMVIKKMPRLEVLRIVTIYVLWNVGLGIHAGALAAIGRSIIIVEGTDVSFGVYFIGGFIILLGTLLMAYWGINFKKAVVKITGEEQGFDA